VEQNKTRYPLCCDALQTRWTSLELVPQNGEVADGASAVGQQHREVSPELAEQIPELPRIVAFRNILIHGYAMVDDALMWQALTDKRPVLDQALRKLLADLSY
jgi:hypothetical protein